MKQTVYFDDGSIFELESKQSDNLLYLRAPHDTERVDFDMGNLTYIPNSNTPNARGHIREDVRAKGAALPEVYRLLPHHSVKLTAPLQYLWYGINPELSVDKWWTLVGYKLAFTNMGSGDSPQNPKANHVAGTNLDKEDPAFDQARFTGGHIFRGRKDSSRAILETIRVDKPLPTAQELLNAKHLWFYATSISPSGRIQYFQRLGKDGTYKRVRIPLFTTREVWLPFADLHLINANDHIAPDAIIHR